jgi:hypothetical protein
VNFGKIPVLDVGTAKRIRDGRIQIMSGLATILEAGVIFEGGKERPFDAIIFATGYRPNFQNFLHLDDSASDSSRGVDPPMYFVGFKKCRHWFALGDFQRGTGSRPRYWASARSQVPKLSSGRFPGLQDCGIGTFRGPSAVQDDRVSVLSLREGSMRDLFASNSAADTLPHFVAKNVGA